MKHVLKKYFIPHEGNNYHPHVLHTKRAVLYSLLFLTMKCIVFFSIVLLPMTVFTLPEVLQEQQIKVITRTNAIREEIANSPLVVNQKLNFSSQLKAEDMATHQYFSHTNPENRGLAYFLAAAGYSYRAAGENLGMGFMDADDLVNAWVNSPTHYKNIIDTEFVEIGVHLAEGKYEDMSTVYVAQHFGTPKQTVASAVVAETPTPEVIDMPTSTEEILKTQPSIPSQKEELTEPSVVSTDFPSIPRANSDVSTSTAGVEYDEESSYLQWQDRGAEGVWVKAVVLVKGEVQEVAVQIENYALVLYPTTSTPELYTSEAVIPISKHDLFKVILPASVSIIDEKNTQILATVAWQNPPVISPTPIEKYITAKKILPFVSSISSFVESVYMLFIALFAIALALMIGIQIKKQHPHIILQTAAMICLLMVLLIV